MTMFLDGYQIDIQTIILYDEFRTQNNYQHIYYVRNFISGNDLSTSCSSESECVYNFTDPCSSSPCKNDGTCFVGYHNDFNCLCPSGFEGN